MTIPFQKTRYHTRLAASPADVLACQRLRHACFFGRPGVDADPFDPICRHLMVETAAGDLVAAVRFFEWSGRAHIHKGYAATAYDLSGLARLDCPMIEIGRFCVAPDALDADVLRVAWAALTAIVDRAGVAWLFGCTSFAGVEPARYGRAFARLAARHQGAVSLRPASLAAETVPLAAIPPGGAGPMPPLLRTYLAMGAWVGDHLVIDRGLQTLHVFTCLEVAAVPPARARALRALAQDALLP